MQSILTNEDHVVIYPGWSSPKAKLKLTHKQTKYFFTLKLHLQNFCNLSFLVYFPTLVPTNPVSLSLP